MWLISSGERIAKGCTKKVKSRQKTILIPEQARPIKARKPHYHKAITNPLSSKKKSQLPPKSMHFRHWRIERYTHGSSAPKPWRGNAPATTCSRYSLRGRRCIRGKGTFLAHLTEALRQDDSQTEGYLCPL